MKKKYRLNKEKFSNFCWNVALFIGLTVFTFWLVNQIADRIISM